jgi:hypothetical protein
VFLTFSTILLIRIAGLLFRENEVVRRRDHRTTPIDSSEKHERGAR